MFVHAWRSIVRPSWSVNVDDLPGHRVIQRQLPMNVCFVKKKNIPCGRKRLWGEDGSGCWLLWHEAKMESEGARWGRMFFYDSICNGGFARRISLRMMIIFVVKCHTRVGESGRCGKQRGPQNLPSGYLLHSHGKWPNYT